jgi:hypothetical protein
MTAGWELVAVEGERNACSNLYGFLQSWKEEGRRKKEEKDVERSSCTRGGFVGVVVEKEGERRR